MRRGAQVGAALAFLVGIALTPLAAAQSHAAPGVVWDGAFRPGSALQWTGLQANPGSFQVVPAAGRSGWAGSFTVRPDDSPVNSGERAEVWQRTDEGDGDHSYWMWSAYFPREFVSNSGWWNVFTQWHHDNAHTGVQPLSFNIDRENGKEWIHLQVRGGDLSNPVKHEWRLAPLVRERWYDFVTHIRWADDSRGIVEVWLNGKLVIAKPGIPTLYTGEGVYFKQGLYRQSSSTTTVVQIANTRRLDSLDGLKLVYRPERHPGFPGL